MTTTPSPLQICETLHRAQRAHSGGTDGCPPWAVEQLGIELTPSQAGRWTGHRVPGQTYPVWSNCARLLGVPEDVIEQYQYDLVLNEIDDEREARDVRDAAIAADEDAAWEARQEKYEGEHLVPITTLEDLRDALRGGDPRVLDQHGQWPTDRPLVAIGPEPDDTAEVWGWDEDRLLVGACGEDLRIVSRSGEGDTMTTTATHCTVCAANGIETPTTHTSYPVVWRDDHLGLAADERTDPSDLQVRADDQDSVPTCESCAAQAEHHPLLSEVVDQDENPPPRIHLNASAERHGSQGELDMIENFDVLLAISEWVGSVREYAAVHDYEVETYDSHDGPLHRIHDAPDDATEEVDRLLHVAYRNALLAVARADVEFLADWENHDGDRECVEASAYRILACIDWLKANTEVTR